MNVWSRIYQFLKLLLVIFFSWWLARREHFAYQSGPNDQKSVILLRGVISLRIPNILLIFINFKNYIKYFFYAIFWIIFKIYYTVKFNYSDGWVCTNTEDPDQTDQIYIVCDSICIFKTACLVEKLNWNSNFRTFKILTSGVLIFRTFMVLYKEKKSVDSSRSLCSSEQKESNSQTD